MADNEKGLMGWSFDIDEVSAGVYRARGTDRKGRSIQKTGVDPEVLLADCRRAAAEMDQETE